ncbi:MAG: hypothetical protein Q8P67_04835, partial [archaeon]|nr:hypothetical protein [archaeon]
SSSSSSPPSNGCRPPALMIFEAVPQSSAHLPTLEQVHANRAAAESAWMSLQASHSTGPHHRACFEASLSILYHLIRLVMRPHVSSYSQLRLLLSQLPLFLSSASSASSPVVSFTVALTAGIAARALFSRRYIYHPAFATDMESLVLAPLTDPSLPDLFQSRLLEGFRPVLAAHADVMRMYGYAVSSFSAGRLSVGRAIAVLQRFDAKLWAEAVSGDSELQVLSVDLLDRLLQLSSSSTSNSFSLSPWLSTAIEEERPIEPADQLWQLNAAIFFELVRRYPATLAVPALNAAMQPTAPPRALLGLLRVLPACADLLPDPEAARFAIAGALRSHRQTGELSSWWVVRNPSLLELLRWALDDGRQMDVRAIHFVQFLLEVFLSFRSTSPPWLPVEEPGVRSFLDLLLSIILPHLGLAITDQQETEDGGDSYDDGEESVQGDDLESPMIALREWIWQFLFDDMLNPGSSISSAACRLVVERFLNPMRPWFRRWAIPGPSFSLAAGRYLQAAENGGGQLLEAAMRRALLSLRWLSTKQTQDTPAVLERDMLFDDGALLLCAFVQQQRPAETDQRLVRFLERCRQHASWQWMSPGAFERALHRHVDWEPSHKLLSTTLPLLLDATGLPSLSRPASAPLVATKLRLLLDLLSARPHACSPFSALLIAALRHHRRHQLLTEAHLSSILSAVLRLPSVDPSSIAANLLRRQHDPRVAFALLRSAAVLPSLPTVALLLEVTLLSLLGLAEDHAKKEAADRSSELTDWPVSGRHGAVSWQLICDAVALPSSTISELQPICLQQQHPLAMCLLGQLQPSVTQDPFPALMLQLLLSLPPPSEMPFGGEAVLWMELLVRLLERPSPITALEATLANDARDRLLRRLSPTPAPTPTLSFPRLLPVYRRSSASASAAGTSSAAVRVRFLAGSLLALAEFVFAGNGGPKSRTSELASSPAFREVLSLQWFTALRTSLEADPVDATAVIAAARSLKLVFCPE